MTEQARVPPANLDAEENVLGAILISPAALEACAAILDRGDFYRESHGVMFAAACRLHERGVPVDAITLSDDLEATSERPGENLLATVGGRARVYELSAIVPASANAAHYARIVKEMALLRSVITIGGEITRSAWDRDGDAASVIEHAQSLAFSLTDTRLGTTDIPAIAESLAATFKRLEELGEAGRDVIGLPTGFTRLDHLTSGFQPGNLIVVAARPSMGKSALGLGFAEYAAVNQGIPVALFTLEMSTSEVTQRLLSMGAMVESPRIRNGRLDAEAWRRLHSYASRLDAAPLHIDDNGALTMAELRVKARRLKTRRPDLGLIIVDYLQLMTPESASGERNRVQEVAQISRALKVLARELDVPVIAVSQLSRAPEQRHDKRPMLSDLRESGAIEQDADIVVFLYRDEYYNPEDPEVEGVAEVIIAKHRNGPTETVKLAWIKRYTRFSNPALPGDVGGP